MPVSSARFYGRTLLVRNIGDLVLVHSLHEPGSRLCRHTHERAYFCVNAGGAYTEEFGRRTRRCTRGMLVFHPAGESHSETHDDGQPVSSLNVEVGNEWLHRLAEVGCPFDRPMEFRDGVVAAAGLQLFEELNRLHDAAALSIECLTWEILAASMKEPVPSAPLPHWLRHARDLIDSRLPAPTLREIAREAGVHPVYFAVVFRRHYSCSLGEYVRRRRLERARQALADADVPLAEVALRAGFADQSHLTRAFKRLTGMSPGEYRTFLPFKTH